MYYLDYLIVFVVVFTLTVLYKKGKYNIVKTMVLSLVIQAEKTYGSGTGELKYATVVKGFYSELPLIIRVLFTMKEVNHMIEYAVGTLKKNLRAGRNLNGHTEEFFLRQ